MSLQYLESQNLNIDCINLNCSTINGLPPSGGGSQNIQQVLTVGDDANFENLSNIASFTNIVTGFLDPDAINSTIRMGMFSGLGGRVNIWQDGDTLDPFNSSAILEVGQINCEGALQVGSKQQPSNLTLDGSLIINEDGAGTGQSTLTATAGNLLSVSGGITTTGNITCNTLNYSSLNPPVSAPAPALSAVLTAGNTLLSGQFIDATGLGATAIDATGSDIIAQNIQVEKITPLGAPIITNLTLDGGLTLQTGGNYRVEFEDEIRIGKGLTDYITSDSSSNLILSAPNYVSVTSTDMYVNTLHYTTLDPPVSGGGITYQTTYANLGTDVLQTAINTLGGGTRKQLIISPGSWTPTGAITFNDLDTVAISGSTGETSITRITPSSGGFTISGASSTRNQFSYLQFGDSFTINGSQGRHSFSYCDFLSGLLITGSTTNYLEFNNCEFSGGNLEIGISFSGVVFFKNCNFTGTSAFTLNNVLATQVIFLGCIGVNPININKCTIQAWNEINGSTRADAVDGNFVNVNGQNGTFTDGTTTILIDPGTTKGIEIQNGLGQGKIKLIDTDGDEIEIQNTEIDVFHSGALTQADRYYQFRDAGGNEVNWYMGSTVPSHPAPNGSLFVLTGLSPNVYQRGPAGWSSLVPTSAVPSQRVLSIGKNVDFSGILAGSPYQIQWNTQQFEQNSLGYFRWPNPNNPRAGASTILVEKTATYLLNCSLAIQYPTSLPAQASFELYIRVYDSSGTLTDNLVDGVDIVPQTSAPSRTYFTLQLSKYKQLNINDRVEVWLASNTANTSQVFGTSLYADQTYLQISIVD